MPNKGELQMTAVWQMHDESLWANGAQALEMNHRLSVVLLGFQIH